MELTPEERQKIYIEEKARLEAAGTSCNRLLDGGATPKDISGREGPDRNHNSSPSLVRRANLEVACCVSLAQWS